MCSELPHSRRSSSSSTIAIRSFVVRSTMLYPRLASAEDARRACRQCGAVVYAPPIDGVPGSARCCRGAVTRVPSEIFHRDKVYRRDDRGAVGVESLSPQGLAFFVIDTVLDARPVVTVPCSSTAALVSEVLTVPSSIVAAAGHSGGASHCGRGCGELHIGGCASAGVRGRIGARTRHSHSHRSATRTVAGSIGSNV